MTRDVDELDASLAMHDDLLARRGVEVWIGAEPTFTRAASLAPAWTHEVDGDDKQARADALAAALGAASDLAGDRRLSVTPAPGVVEVSLAPCASARSFAQQARQIWDAAHAAGLSATRFRCNGDLIDAGGGGEISLGGARPEHSPFVRYPHVLPALLRYLNNHPSLSYWFASEHVGSASRGPRPDEGTRERWDELAVTLGWLERRADRGDLPPDVLWQALGSLLGDASGDAHRAELNVEKLWNPRILAHGQRDGQMGLVELRAIRMPERPAMLTALAVLLRSIVARLIVSDYRAPLVDWHDELHDRFALPAALSLDLRLVLGDLDEHGLGVPAQLRPELEAWRPAGILGQLGDATLTLRPALEPWPVVGDVAAQGGHGARIVDASTQRWEIAVDGPGPDRVLVSSGGAAGLEPRWARLHPLGDGVRAVGVRRRIHEPALGLHPGMPAQDPLIVEWAWAGRAQRIELYAGRPGGGAYTDLPLDECEAIARRQARIVVTTLPLGDGDLAAPRHWPERRPFTIDLRAQ